jgi:hypothetical protein
MSIHFDTMKGANAIYIYDHRSCMHAHVLRPGGMDHTWQCSTGFKFKNHERCRRGHFIKTAQGAGFQVLLLVCCWEAPVACF